VRDCLNARTVVRDSLSINSQLAALARTSRRGVVPIVLLVGAFLTHGSARAQTGDVQPSTSTLSGVVLDQTGTPVPDVEVIVASTTTGLQRSVRTDAEGTFLVPLLPAGQYVVTAQREGFAAAELNGVVLNADDVRRLRIELKVASIGETVIVTAQKRGEERLQDVPVPVTVLDARKLGDYGQVLVRDYYSTVPGFSLAPGYLNQQRLSLRGIMTGASSPTVGFAVDDVSFGGSMDYTGGVYVPDIDPSDLAGIEVLRGPQGTLYGANSMGGLVKYVTLDPSFAGYSGRLEFGADAVHNGHEPGYTLRASVNAPLSETWAIRASAFTRQDAGYIDNPVLHINGLNSAVGGGGRLSALWRASPNMSLKLSAMFQHIQADGSSEVEVAPGLGDLQQNFLANTRGYKNTVQAYSALLKAKVGGIDLTSITGYNLNDLSATDDRSFNYRSAVQALYGVTGAPYLILSPTKKVTQEIRLSAPIGSKAEWLAGAFVTHEDGPIDITMEAEDTVTGARVGPFYKNVSPRTFNEYAAFGDLTYHVTSRFDVQVGGRESRDALNVPENAVVGPFASAVLHQPSPVVTPGTESRTNVFTYLVTPRFRASSDFIVYGRFASGYRPGGPNQLAAVAVGGPALYEPDKTQNYEIGIKRDFPERRFSIDISLYHIDWKNIQIAIRDPASGFFWNANGGTARSQGIECSTTLRPVSGLTISAWAAYDDAVLTENFPATSTAYGVVGDRLPFATRASGYVSLDQEFPLRGKATAFLGGSANYIGARVGTFQATSQRQDLPAYTETDLRGGVRYDSWIASVYVNNVADTRGLINGGIGYIPTNVFVYIQPRTVGFSLTKAF
jgi:outer membrane receptor protein involved in Fe transport